MRYTNKQIRNFISCPQFGDRYYGKWGGLRLEVRRSILNLLEVNESMEHVIKDLEKENQRLKKQKDDVVEYIKKETKEFHFENDKLINILRMLGEIDE